MRLLINFVLNVVAITIAPRVVVGITPGIYITPDKLGNFIAVAIVFIIINAVVMPVLRFIGTPLTCLTLGLFALVINGAALLIVEWMLNTFDVGIGHLVVNSWGSAIFGAIVLSLVSSLVNFFTSPLRGPV
ncbi:phage holin family protein [Corynebacterium macginleyi]|uniref:phage holin family protein n=1 Tax=Corynebacterium macginleyi TaxID=38290 RepID=UPI000EF97E87|nr:phage holin family protein [Corynebacterium macginleyi]QRP21473.1 phage holin family protein [Corynebacterium macginleyi]RMB67142.1 phage holin family protein [Corynebacterium macginleyi]